MKRVLILSSDVLRDLRKLRPHHKFIEDFCDDNVRDRMKVQNERGAELLETFGRSGWTDLEESLKNSLESQGLLLASGPFIHSGSHD
jgi:hypothetical protein